MKNLKHILSNKYRNNIFLAFESLIVGVLVGIIISAFRKSIDYLSQLRTYLYTDIVLNNPVLIFPVILIVCCIGIAIGVLIKNFPMVKGSGVSQIKGNFMKKFSLKTWPELPIKFLGGVIDIGLGLSVGREGPSVQIGAYVGNAFHKIGKTSHLEQVSLTTAGAAAGLAATFGAPFAGIIFAIEDLHQYLSPLILTCVMAGAFAGDFTASFFFKPGALFEFKNIQMFPLKYFIWLIILGICTALTAHIFKQAIYVSQKIYKKIKIPAICYPAIPFLISVPICIFLPYAAGGGDSLIEDLTHYNFNLQMLFILLIVKILFTGLSAGSGAIGGIFVPLLLCGALSGVIFSKTLVFFDITTQEYQINFMIFAMAGFFAAVIKAPLTAVILLAETSGNILHFGGLVLTALTSYITANIINSPANDEVILKQLLKEHKNHTAKTKS